jgi:hypothetical protein
MKRRVLSGVECYPTLGQPGTQVVEHQVRDALDLRLGERLEQRQPHRALPKVAAELPAFLLHRPTP